MHLKTKLGKGLGRGRSQILSSRMRDKENGPTLGDLSEGEFLAWSHTSVIASIIMVFFKILAYLLALSSLFLPPDQSLLYCLWPAAGKE